MPPLCMPMSSTGLCLRPIRAERKVQISARTFQLLARSSHASRTCRASKDQQRPIRGVASGSATRLSLRTYHSGPQESSPLVEAVKVNMRAVKYPVAVITTSDPKLEGAVEDKGAWRGATVASYNTVSMNPAPLVSFNMYNMSSTLTAIRRSGYFAVNVLNQTPSAAYLADLFAQSNDKSPFLTSSPGLSFTPDNTGIDENFYAGRKWFLPSSKASKFDGNPLLIPPRIQYAGNRNYPRAVLFSFLCHTSSERMISAGDHVVVLGRVVHLMSPPGVQTFMVHKQRARERELERQRQQQQSPTSVSDQSANTDTNTNSTHKYDDDLSEGENDGPTAYVLREADNLTYQHGRYSIGADDMHRLPRKRIFSSVRRRLPILSSYASRMARRDTAYESAELVEEQAVEEPVEEQMEIVNDEYIEPSWDELVESTDPSIATFSNGGREGKQEEVAKNTERLNDDKIVNDEGRHHQQRQSPSLETETETSSSSITDKSR